MICVVVVASGAEWESRALAVLKSAPDVVVLKRCVDVEDLLATVTAGQAEVAVVALDAPGLDAAAVEHLVRHRVRTVAVVAGDPGASLDAARARAARWGITTQLAETELDRLPELLQAPVPAGPGEAEAVDTPEPDLEDDGAEGTIVVVWGPRGSPGRTTVAVGIAAEVAARGPSVLLIDADPYGGAVAQHLGVLDETSGLLAATRLATAGDLARGFAGVQRSVGAGLRVLTGLPRPDRWSEVRPTALEDVILAARGSHTADLVVVDTGFGLDAEPAPELGSRPGRDVLTVTALQLADRVVVVGTPDPVGLARLASGLADLRELFPDQAVDVVINRHRASLGWSTAEIGELVATFAAGQQPLFLPADQVAVDRAAASGRTLVESGDSALRRSLAGLVDAVVPELAAPTSRRGLRGGKGRSGLRRRRAGTTRRR